MRTYTGSGSTLTGARVNSPALSQTGPGCALEFYYYINNTGRNLAVYGRYGTQSSRLFYTIWTTSGKWKRQVAWLGTRPAGTNACLLS